MPTKKSKFRKIKFLLKLTVILGVLGVVGVGGIFAYYAKDLPSPANIREIKISESTKIYDRTGEVLLYDIHGEQKRTIISFEEIPEYIKVATIVAEDDDFYRHFGIDFKGIARAVLTNLRGKTVLQGGSTITQQLIKNIYLSPERTLPRKIKELILALELEVKYDKDEILSFYLNAVPYGSNAYGVEAASQTFFNKHARELTLAESSLLASLPNAPTYYSPFGNNPEKLLKRQRYILGRMHDLGYITNQEFVEAKNEKLLYSKELTGIKAPHFVMYVREYLEKTYGQDQLKSSGLNIITTLDWELQQEAEKIVAEWADKNEERFRAKNAALIAIDPASGQILTMVGSRDYFDIENDGNVNVTTRLRQPGSSFKPFVYANAFEKGYTPDTVVFDVETNFGVQGTKEYIPKNYNEKFRGPIKLKEALAQSINVPAVKVLYLAGIADTIKLARALGIDSIKKDPSHYGLSLVLGGGEVTLLEETAAYGVFSQDGIYNKPTSIISVTSKTGEVLEQTSRQGQDVLSPQVSRLINAILSDNDLRSPVFGKKNNLTLENIPSAAKTGTTQDYRDAWTVGYTPKISVGVWVGNNDNSTMIDAAGVKAAAPIWHDFMEMVYQIKDWEVSGFIPPKPTNTDKPVLNGSLGGSVKVPIDVVSGKLATEYTPKELIEERVFYEPFPLLYFIDKDNPRGAFPKNPEEDPQYIPWQEGIQKWVQENYSSQKENNTTSSVVFGLPPREYDDVHTKENTPRVSILSPLNNTALDKETPIHLLLSMQNTFPVQKIEVFLDNTLLASINGLSIQNREYSSFLRIPPSFTEKEGSPLPQRKIHTLTIKVFDTVLNKGVARLGIFLE